MSLHEEKSERLAKKMARSGLCSRRDAERWIYDGRVKVDNKTVMTPATLVTAKSFIVVDDKPLGKSPPSRLWIYNKPAGLLTTHYDPQGRPTIFDALSDCKPFANSVSGERNRVISIGRLDLNSEGLILLTNDGALARYAELPSTGWARSYRVRVFGTVDERALQSLSWGITLEGMTYGPIEAEIADLTSRERSNTWIFMTLFEGKNREIRKIMDYLGLRVNRLIRVSYGTFTLDDLPVGQVREIPQRQLTKAFPIVS